MKITTIGQVAIASFKSSNESSEWKRADGIIPSSIIFEGYFTKMRDQHALQMAELHPDFMNYYSCALMVLWRGGKGFRAGTEDPVRAVLSMLPNTQKYPFIIAWRPLT